MGKRTAQKDTITDNTSDSQLSSNFPYRWSRASLTFNNIFIYNGNNYKYQHFISKISKEPKQMSRFGTASNEITAGLKLVCGRPTLALCSVLVHQTKQSRTTETKRIKHKQKAKRAAGVEGQMDTVLESQQDK